MPHIHTSANSWLRPNFCCTSSWDWSHSSIRRRSAAARDYAISARCSPVAIGSQVTERPSLGNSIRKPWLRVSRNVWISLDILIPSRSLPYLTKSLEGAKTALTSDKETENNRKEQQAPSFGFKKTLCFERATSLCFFSCTAWESPPFCIKAFCSAWSFCIRSMTCGRSDSGCLGNSECTWAKLSKRWGVQEISTADTRPVLWPLWHTHTHTPITMNHSATSCYICHKQYLT